MLWPAGRITSGQIGPTPAWPDLPVFGFLKTTAYTDKDYEGLAFFQLVPSQTGRFKNGPGRP